MSVVLTAFKARRDPADLSKAGFTRSPQFRRRP